MDKTFIIDYFNNNAFPIIIEVFLIISFLILPSEAHIYVNTLFYLLLFVYIIYKKDFSLKDWLAYIKSEKDFWKKTLLTIFGFIFAVFISLLLENAFPNLNTGEIKLYVNNWPSLLCFVLSTILLPAITEETVFRKNMIVLNKKVLLFTSLLSMLLYSLEHFLTIWGLLLGVIWAIPLTFSYIKTKDVYIPMTAHFIVGLFGNGLDVIKLFIKMLN